MSRLLDPIPNNYDDPTLKRVFMTIQNILQNFTGAWLKDSSVTNAKLLLSPRGIAPSRINFGEWVITTLCPFVTSTTSTVFILCSDIFQFNPAMFPAGAWHFETSMAIGAAADTVHVRLMGAAEIANVLHTGNTHLTLRRSGVLTMPTSTVNLWVELRTSNAATTARFAGAKLVFIPN